MSKFEIVHCESCDTWLEGLEGQRQPDYEGHCPICGEESNWSVYQEDEIIEALNEKDKEIEEFTNKLASVGLQS